MNLNLPLGGYRLNKSAQQSLHIISQLIVCIEHGCIISWGITTPLYICRTVGFPVKLWIGKTFKFFLLIIRCMHNFLLLNGQDGFNHCHFFSSTLCVSVPYTF